MTNANLALDSNDQTLSGLFIPPCPTVLTSILQAAKHPAADIETISHLISKDAGLVAPLLKLANSPFIGLRSKVTSVFHAVSVLGLQKTMNLLQNIALRQSLSGNAQSFEKFWERSSLTASVAERLAAKFPTVSKDDAYVTALFHDCGIPVLIQKFPDYRDKIMMEGKKGNLLCETENTHFSTNHAVVGNMLTRTWALPPHVCKAILYHHDTSIFSAPSTQIGNEVLDLIGLVHMAECIVDEHLHVKDKEWHLYAHDVLEHFELHEQEFSELKDDMLAHLNDD